MMKISARKLIVLLGPTAVGKSSATVKVAERLDGEIISADSRQVYRGMDVATAKPDLSVRATVRHHLVDIVDPDVVFSAGQYRHLALGIINRLDTQGKTPIIVGGTGLYIRTLLYGLWPGPKAHWDFRDRLLEEERLSGHGHLHRRLSQVDPDAAKRIHPHDRVKTVRALEVAFLTGVSLTQNHRAYQLQGNHQLQADRLILIGLRREREDLYRRINLRVEEMLQKGLIQETERLRQAGFNQDLPSMRGLGYPQVAGYLQGLYSIQEAVRLIKRDTRRYAKRQMTWFRKEPRICWIDLKSGDGSKEAAEKILDRLCSSAVQPAEPSIFSSEAGQPWCGF
jgi:tRNA dimethylallyltransferase